MKVDAGLQAAGLQDGQHDLLGRAGVGGALQHDQLTRLQVRGRCLARRDSMKEMSGALAAVYGVGTQMKITSRSATTA